MNKLKKKNGFPDLGTLVKTSILSPRDHWPLMKRARDEASTYAPRTQLPSCSTLDDVLRVLAGAKNVVVLCGAGISVSCGIPDFRSEGGIYQLVEEMGLELDDPQVVCSSDDGIRKHPSPYPTVRLTCSFHSSSASLISSFLRTTRSLFMHLLTSFTQKMFSQVIRGCEWLLQTEV